MVLERPPELHPIRSRTSPLDAAGNSADSDTPNRRSPLLPATDWGQSLRLALAGKAASMVGRDYAENRRIPTAAAFIPPPVRPHPLLGGLADEGFELFLEGGGGDDGVGLAIAGLGDGNAR